MRLIVGGAFRPGLCAAHFRIENPRDLAGLVRAAAVPLILIAAVRRLRSRRPDGRIFLAAVRDTFRSGRKNVRSPPARSLFFALSLFSCAEERQFLIL
jgi:hypothetical protein